MSFLPKIYSIKICLPFICIRIDLNNFRPINVLKKHTLQTLWWSFLEIRYKYLEDAIKSFHFFPSSATPYTHFVWFYVFSQKLLPWLPISTYPIFVFSALCTIIRLVIQMRVWQTQVGPTLWLKHLKSIEIWSCDKYRNMIMWYIVL